MKSFSARLTRRSFLSAASAALSLVGITLPEAKAKTLVSIPEPTQPQVYSHCNFRRQAEFSLTLDGSYRLSKVVCCSNFDNECLISVGNETGFRRAYWLDPHECRFDESPEMPEFRAGETVYFRASWTCNCAIECLFVAV